ncbi:MAG: glycoside hydrolase family 3 N-terminal domain-containing protein [Pseudomonadota bacterium]
MSLLSLAAHLRKKRALSLVFAAALSACGGGGSPSAGLEQLAAVKPDQFTDAQGVVQPTLGSRTKAILKFGQFTYRDLNTNGKLDQYENWRLPVDVRVADLVKQMTLDEKAGMLLIDTLSAPNQGSPLIGATALRFVNDENMKRFIFRSTVQVGPTGVSPVWAAQFTNAVQELAEATRLGIPVIFKSNARNHYDRNARQGINEPAGSFSQWPKEPGLAAIRDMAVIRDFGETIGTEWAAIGLRGSYAYMFDTATDPRWFRVHETFSEDADLNADIAKNLVQSWQGGTVSPNTKVAMTIKHFPGGGPAAGGLDAHYTFGKFASYSGGRFADHLKPFQAAIDAGVSAIMPYYSVPENLTYDGVTFDEVGFAFNKQAITDLLKTKMGFKGYVNSDTGIIGSRAWGMEDKTVAQQIAAAINAGTDVLSGFNSKQAIIDVVNSGLVSQTRLDEAVTSLLKEQFALGLFENPYVDDSKANDIVGKPSFLAKALDAQRKSLTLLKNDATLPLATPTPAAPVRLYSINLNSTILGDAAYGGYQVTTGDRTAANGNTRAPVPAGTHYAVIRVEVSNASGSYRSNGATTGANPAFINPRTGLTWGAQDPAGIDNGLNFGGAFPWEVNTLDFTGMAAAQSWRISPTLPDIKATMAEANAVGAKVVLSVYFRQPYVLDDASGLKSASAIVANYGVSDTALMDVLTGKHKPQGKLPWALANKPAAVVTQDPDAPGYAAADTLYPFGHGLTY